jgi:hypothetical protein
VEFTFTKWNLPFQLTFLVFHQMVYFIFCGQVHNFFNAGKLPPGISEFSLPEGFRGLSDILTPGTDKPGEFFNN